MLVAVSWLLTCSLSKPLTQQTLSYNCSSISAHVNKHTHAHSPSVHSEYDFHVHLDWIILGVCVVQCVSGHEVSEWVLLSSLVYPFLSVIGSFSVI